MFRRSKLIVLFVSLLVVSILIQTNQVEACLTLNTVTTKAGNCPTPAGLGICLQQCNIDGDCAGAQKCV